MPEPLLSHPLPPMIERNLRAQALLPSQRPLIDFFSRQLEAFQSSGAKFQVICTLPGQRAASVVVLAPSPPQTRPRTLVVLDSSFNPPTIAHLRMATSALRDSRENKDDNGKRSEENSRLRLLLLLAINNADKAPKPAAFEQRLAMMWAFAKDIQETLSRNLKDAETEQEPVPEEQEREEGLSIDLGLSTDPYFTNKSAAIAASPFYLTTGEASEKEPEQIILAGYDTLIRIFNPKYYGEPSGTSEAPIRSALDPFFARARLRITMRTDDEWGGKEEQLAYLESLLTGDRLEEIGGNKKWVERIDMVEGRVDGEDIVSSTLARDAAGEQDWESLGKMVSPHVQKWVEVAKLYTEGK